MTRHQQRRHLCLHLVSYLLGLRDFFYHLKELNQEALLPDADELAASLRLRDELWTSVGFALPAAAADEDGAAALPVLRKLCADWGPGVATPEAHLRRHGGDVDLAVASLLTECVGRGAMRRLGFGELPSADGVPWVSGALLLPGVARTNGTWGPRAFW